MNLELKEKTDKLAQQPPPQPVVVPQPVGILPQLQTQIIAKDKTIKELQERVNHLQVEVNNRNGTFFLFSSPF